MAVATAIKKLCPEAQILFAGVGRPAEGNLLDAAGWDRVVLAGKGFKGVSKLAKVKALIMAVWGFFQAILVIWRFKPTVFFGAGSYVAGPVGLAAYLNFKPLALHEQNSRPGLTNRLLAKLAKIVFVGFPKGVEAFPKGKAVLTGNPIRPEIAALYGQKKNYNPHGPLYLLFLGGSQGSNRVNTVAMEVVAALAKAHVDFEVFHQTGVKGEGLIKTFYNRLGVRHETKAFFSDPERLYAKAHLGVTRAGALTVTELAAVGLPAILIPLPSAADDHQTINAQGLAALGAALVKPETELYDIVTVVKRLVEDPHKLNSMSGLGRSLVNLEAATVMATHLLRLSGWAPPAGQPLASNPLASDPSAGNPSASDPLASNPLASNPLASNPSVSNPLESKPSASKPTESNPSESKPSASNPLESKPVNLSKDDYVS
jgi:UDP-N-acetylglucosamine--N-acetylmuramyl-(pentapeptide) pyrophosphoryl-undecaprenol N-acetylglucosamine transferase